MEAQHPRAWILGVEAIAHNLRPQPARRAEFRYFFEEVVVRVEEKRKLGSEGIYLQPGIDSRLNVSNRIRNRKSHFLHCGRARLADMVTGDADRIPVRHVCR